MMSAKKATKATKPEVLPARIEDLTHDPLTKKPLLNAVKCSRCGNVVFENSAQPVILPDGGKGFLCYADRQAALIPKRTDKPVAIIVCTRNGEAVASDKAVPVRVPVESSDPTQGTAAIVHMCPACYDLAMKDDEAKV